MSIRNGNFAPAALAGVLAAWALLALSARPAWGSYGIYVGKNLTAAFGILVPLAVSVLSVVIPGLK